MDVCSACGKELSINRAVGRRDECPACHADLHSCRNCRFTDRSAPKECREPQASLVRDKEKANFCDFFSCAKSERRSANPDQATQSRKTLEDLFRKE